VLPLVGFSEIINDTEKLGIIVLGGESVIKEILSHERQATLLSIQDSHILSTQQNNTSSHSLRIYYSGLIGVAGACGEHDELELEKRAMGMLKSEIPYLPEVTQDQQICVIYNYDVAHGSDFVSDMELLLKDLRQNFSEFSFSNAIQLIDQTHKIQNNAGLFCQYQDHYLDLMLNFKHHSSTGETDGSLYCFGRRFIHELFLSYCEEKLNAYLNPCKILELKRYPVIFPSNERALFKNLIFDLDIRNMANKSSTLSGKLGQRLFNEDFTFYQSHHSEKLLVPFFDAEGTVHLDSDYRVPLIQNGEIVQAFSDKRCALEYGMPHTGSATAKHDELPTVELAHYELKAGNHSLSQLLQGEKGILVDRCSESIINTEGDFEITLLKSYLSDGEKVLGLLPPLKLKTSAKELFDKHFVGVTKDPLNPLNSEHGIVVNMQLQSI
jgi:PmbA protein